MAGDCTYNTHYANDDTFGTIKQSSDGQQDLVRDVNGVRTVQGTASSPPSPYFEEIGGSLYRKKLERGFVQYREVLAEDKRLNAIATFHQKRPGRRHHTLEDTYRFVAEHYWWEGKLFISLCFVLFLLFLKRSYYDVTLLCFVRFRSLYALCELRSFMSPRKKNLQPFCVGCLQAFHSELPLRFILKLL